MKKITLLTVKEKAKDNYLDNLKYFFDGLLNIDAYSLEKGVDFNCLNTDLIIVTDLVVYTYIKNKIPKGIEIIYLVYTYPKKAIEQLQSLKEGERVLFVEANEHLATSSIKVIEKLNIRKLDMVPYCGKKDDLGCANEDVQIAITPDVNKYIPDNIKDTINISSKMVDISIIRYIVAKYQLISYILSKKMYTYTEESILMENYHGDIIEMIQKFNIKNNILENKVAQKSAKNNENKGYSAKWVFQDIVHTSKVMTQCIDKAMKIASIDQITLIIGETGTGKEMFANAIHNASSRKNKPIIAINCAALSESVLESELFGYEYGAFTGAKKEGRKGLFELADGGSIFLDEIGEISLNFQAKLLRVLQEGEIMRIGSNTIIPIDVRVIAATNKNLRTLVEEKKFREDLFYRLNVFTIIIPSLRERREDIAVLISDTLEKYKGESKKISNDLMDLLINYRWGGNVRELKNCMEYMLYMGGEKLTISDLPPFIHSEQKEGDDIEGNCQQFNELYNNEKEIVVAILDICTLRTVGRRNLHLLLKEQGYSISEYKLRSILEIMRSKGLLYFGKGREGIKVVRNIFE